MVYTELRTSTHPKFNGAGYTIIFQLSDTYACPDAATLAIKHRMLESGSIFLSDHADVEQTVFAEYTFYPTLTNSYEKFQIDYHSVSSNHKY